MKFFERLRRSQESKDSFPESTPEQVRSFNQLFVLANHELAKGNLEALREGIRIFSEALNYAGKSQRDLQKAISHLQSAEKLYSRADTKGPWNWDLSGYGLFSWKLDLARRDEQLSLAWRYIEPINNELISQGLGFRFR